MRVAIYIRVSTKMQEDRFSLSAQTYELKKYADSMGWEIVDIYKDVDSGTKLDKDGLISMLDAVEDGLIDVVLCIEQDRLSRLDTVKWEYLKGILRDNKVKIAEPGNIVDLTNINDEFMSDLKNLMAQLSRKDMLRKMARGLRQRTREGKVWGPQPSEYNYNPLTEEITIIEERAWIIPFIDDLYLVKKMGPTAIALELNKRCKSPTGRDWSESQVVTRLKSEAYHGVFVRVFDGDAIRSKDDVYPKLRTKETFNRIQSELSKRYNWKPASPHLLRGIDFKCASCNNVLLVNKTSSLDRKKEKRYTLHILLHSSPNLRNQCQVNPYINVNRIEHNIITAVKDILTNQDKAKEYIDSDFDDNELKVISHSIEELEKQNQSIRAKIDRLLDLYLDGTWPKEKLDKTRSELDQQLMTIKKDIDEKTRKRNLIQSNQINYDTVVEYLSVADRFEDLLDVEEQQELLGSLFPSATLDAEKNILTLHTYLPQGVTVDINIKIETTDESLERETLTNARKRYDKAQKYLNKNKGSTMKDLAKAIGASPPTLNVDQERFGPFKHLAPHWSCPELRQARIDAIKAVLKKDPQASGRKLERESGVYRKLVYKLIKEEGLRP